MKNIILLFISIITFFIWSDSFAVKFRLQVYNGSDSPLTASFGDAACSKIAKKGEYITCEKTWGENLADHFEGSFVFKANANEYCQGQFFFMKNFPTTINMTGSKGVDCNKLFQSPQKIPEGYNYYYDGYFKNPSS